MSKVNTCIITIVKTWFCFFWWCQWVGCQNNMTVYKHALEAKDMFAGTQLYQLFETTDTSKKGNTWHNIGDGTVETGKWKIKTENGKKNWTYHFFFSRTSRRANHMSKSRWPMVSPLNHGILLDDVSWYGFKKIKIWDGKNIEKQQIIYNWWIWIRSLFETSIFLLEISNTSLEVSKVLFEFSNVWFEVSNVYIRNFKQTYNI